MKIFISDYDGTLNRGGGITERDLAALTAFKRAGNLFGVATGRSFAMLAAVWGKTVLCPDFVVGAGGAQVYNGMGVRLLDFAGDGSLVPEIGGRILREGGKIVHFSVDNTRYIVAVDGKFPEKTKDIYVPADGIPKIPRVHSINTYFDTTERAVDFCERFNREYAGRFTAYNNTDCADIVPFGSGKRAGIAAYLALAGLENAQVVTAGDSGNDLEMLLAYDGYTVESADRAVRERLGGERVLPDIAGILERGFGTEKGTA